MNGDKHMNNPIFIAGLVIAILTFPIYKWAEAKYNERAGITAFFEECEAAGGKVVTVVLHTCVMP